MKNVPEDSLDILVQLVDGYNDDWDPGIEIKKILRNVLKASLDPA